jgi:hypothetical protein
MISRVSMRDSRERNDKEDGYQKSSHQIREKSRVSPRNSRERESKERDSKERDYR